MELRRLVLGAAEGFTDALYPKQGGFLLRAAPGSSRRDAGKGHRIEKEDFMKTDVVIIGAGPAGIFTAIEMLKKGSRQHIVMVEKGPAISYANCGLW